MKHRAKKSRWWQRHRIITVVAVVVVIALGALGGLVYSVVSKPLPLATFTSLVTDSVSAPSKTVSVAWPAQGEGGYSVPSLRVSGDSPTQTAVPIGSITKMMTAYVVLKDYPLAPGQSGFSVTVSQTDVNDYELEQLDGQSVVAVAPGEVLSEYQLLEGMLVHSGNDYAGILADHDAGSVPGFVLKMNAQAALLAMANTHYNDASGYDPGSVSTPHDQLILAADLLENPVFSSIVAMTSVTLPVAGQVTTFQPLLGTNGIVGVKSGLTSQAAGCDVMAVNTSIAGQSVQILTAVTGQQGSNRLGAAGTAALAIATSVRSTIETVTVAKPEVAVATLGWPKSTTPLAVDQSVALPAWPGQSVIVSVVQIRNVTTAVPKNRVVATLHATSGPFVVHVPVKTVHDLPEPTLLQRVV